jgi:hypothetical protein
MSNNNEAIQLLEEYVQAGKVTGDFGPSLVKQFATKGDLSDKQWPWVFKLVDEANDRNDRPTEDLGDLSGVYELMAIASHFIKWPKIKLATDDGEVVKLIRAGEKSKYPGQINVTDGGDYGFNTWYGRIDTQGEMTKSRDCTETVIELLKRLGQDPHKVAAEYGNRFSECCFCGKALTDDNSVAAGYGPTCANHYGLKENWKASLDQATVDPRPRKEGANDGS